MSIGPDGITVTRTERLLGIGRPIPRSRFWVVFSALLTAFAGGSIIRLVISEGWNEEGYAVLGALFAGLWLLSDVGGVLLYARRGAAWGRSLRVIGYAVFLPLVGVAYLIGSWFTSPWLFFAQVVFLLLVALVFGTRAVVRRARRNGAARQDG